MALEIKKSNHDLAPWDLAGVGWKDYIRTRTVKLTQERNWSFNTPKTAQVDSLFADALGVENISQHWKISSKYSAQHSRDQLDKFVTLRGAIAHRGNSENPVRKKDVMTYGRLVVKIAVNTGLYLDDMLTELTGESPVVFV